MRRWTTGLLALLVALSFSVPAFAQGGGASSTGTIQGRVTDAQGAVLPGVTVTATSPALIQPQTTVTSETGNYRFPAVPPRTYSGNSHAAEPRADSPTTHRHTRNRKLSLPRRAARHLLGQLRARRLQYAEARRHR